MEWLRSISLDIICLSITLFQAQRTLFVVLCDVSAVMAINDLPWQLRASIAEEPRRDFLEPAQEAPHIIRELVRLVGQTEEVQHPLLEIPPKLLCVISRTNTQPNQY